MKKYSVVLTFIEPILGAVPKDPDVYATFVAGKAALADHELAEELASVEKVEEKGWTGFHRLADGTPFLMNYVIKGFFKDACGALRRAEDTKSAKLKAYKKEIDGLVFVRPRQIPININGGQMGVLERPLRAQTAQGERVTLARSDTCPAGSHIEFTLEVWEGGGINEKLLAEWLDYGQYRGLGQWRNADYGSFTYEISEVLA